MQPSLVNRRFISLSLGFLLATLAASCATTKIQPEEAMIVQGNEFVKEGLLREASQAYKKALKTNSASAIARRNLGIVELKLKNYKNGVVYLERVVSQYENDFDTNFWYAEGLRATERYADAIFHYKKALSIKEDHPRTLKALAWSYYKIRFYSEAFSIAKQLQKKAPQDLQTAVIMARIQIKLDQPQQALASLAKAKANAKPDSLPYIQSVEGDAFLAMDRCTDATSSFREALHAQPLLPGPLLGLGRCQLEAGKTAQAIGYLERAVRIKPNFTEAVFALAKAYEGNNQAKALKYYKTFRKLAMKDPEFVDRLGEAKSKIAKLAMKNDDANRNTSSKQKN